MKTSLRQSSGATETWLRYSLIQFKCNKTSENANKAGVLKTSPHCLTVFCSA